MVERGTDRSGLSVEDRSRLRFQLEHCSITEKNRRATVAAAVRRSRAKTGGRKRDPYRPYPDSDRFIADEMANYATQFGHQHPLRAITAQAKSDAIRRCITVDGRDHQLCGSTGCSRCRAREARIAQELGETMLRQDLAGVERNRIRAATILLFAAPLNGKTDSPVGLAHHVFQQMQRVHGRARRIGFNFLLLPEFKVLEPLEVMRHRHHRAYVEAILPDWDRSSRVLVAHVHGLIVLPERDEGRTLHGLRETYSSPRAVLLKGLHQNQSIQEAVSRWMNYSGKQEGRHDIQIRENHRLGKLYRASDFLLIDQILHRLSDDVSIFEWSGQFSADPDQWTWGEILEDLLEVTESHPKPRIRQSIIYVYHYWRLFRRRPTVGRCLKEGIRIRRPLRSSVWPTAPPLISPGFPQLDSASPSQHGKRCTVLCIKRH